MQTITPEFVDALIDFAPGEAQSGAGFAHHQREGTVAVFNMLARNGCAYLADEVGMGKTYVAIAVMSLLRYLDPNVRCLVLAPRENIQLKWKKELDNFVRVNWRVIGNRVKAIQGGPVWEPVICHNLFEFAREALLDQDRDFFLRMWSFSLAVNERDMRKKLRRRLRDELPWIPSNAVDVRSADGFRDSFGRALNGAVPDLDLVVVDEAHNLKHGFGPRVSNRNRILGLALGHPEGTSSALEWYRHRAKRVLLLSATPFEEDYGDIQRQLDVFGHGGVLLRDGSGGDPLPVGLLVEQGSSDAEKRSVVERLLVRRAAGLLIGGELHTKNMYRREWRRGGFTVHDEPIRIDQPRERLVIALMQKKVSEVLQSERFNNHFQIGMLSSFESFLETIERGRRSSTGHTEEENAEGYFDDVEQNRRANRAERQGIDTKAIRSIVRSYGERFGTPLPHPKLDAAANAHANVFETGEKALLFVRRVATVGELAAKVEGHFDRWVRQRMETALPDLREPLAAIFTRYERERLRRPEETVQHETDLAEAPAEDDDERWVGLEADEGGAESFFAWFFRGEGPPGLLSGAAFQRNRLASTSAAYATLFEDDHVAWLLGSSGDEVLDALARASARSSVDFAHSLRRHAYAHLRGRSGQREGYPRLYVFEAYQVAALRALAATGGALAERATVVLEERYPGPVAEALEPPAGFPAPRGFLGATTFFTELARDGALCAALWPADGAADFRERLRRREQRRELLSAMVRLGAAYIDLYLLAVRNLGSFELRVQREEQDLPERLARQLVALLSQQREAGAGFNAYRELALAAEAFDHIIAVNFPEVPSARLSEIARIYAATLQKQVPVGRMHGGVNKRLVRQFRMPGFPLVLVTTDVLQEGEDLHTFCKRVVHYGMSWTSSATEQRTGRIDRIGGLVQRRLDGAPTRPPPEELIQVYFPHLRDTVEVLQVRRVLRRLNRFLELMHVTGRSDVERDSHLDAARAILEETADIPPIEEKLEPAFPVREEWRRGELGLENVRAPDLQAHLEHFTALLRTLRRERDVELHPTGGGTMARGNLAVEQGAQTLSLALRSQRAGDAVLLRASSEVGQVDLRDGAEVDRLDEFLRAGTLVKLCLLPRTRADRDTVMVQDEIAFSQEYTQLGDVEALIDRTAHAAARLRVGQPWFGSFSHQHADVNTLLPQIDALIVARGLSWERRKRTVHVRFPGLGRGQKVQLGRVGALYRFYSVLERAEQVSGPARRRGRLLLAWTRNARTDMVGFGLDHRGRFIGFLDQPASCLDAGELEVYLSTVARECDRLEYVLSGEDVR